MKTIPILILTLLLLISHTACNGNTDTPSNTEQTAATTQAETAFPPSETYPETDPAPWTVEPEPVYTFPLVITDLDDLRELAEDDYSANNALLFLTGDTDSLLTSNDPKLRFDFEKVSTVKVSEFKLTYESEEVFENSAPVFEFTVTESRCDTFPVGEYSYTMCMSPTTMWEKTETLSVPEEYDFPAKIVDRISAHCFSMKNGKRDPQDSAYQFEMGLLKTLFTAERTVLEDGYPGGATLEQLAEDAALLYGIENYTPDEDVYSFAAENDIRILPRELGGTVVCGELAEIREEDGRVIFVKQLYADDMFVVPSHRVEYVFEKTDTKYGWRLVEINCVERSRHAPARYSF